MPSSTVPFTTRFTVPSRFTRSITISMSVAVPDLADRAAGERLGRDVADAGAGGDAAEARVGDHGDVLAEVQMLAAPR